MSTAAATAPSVSRKMPPAVQREITGEAPLDLTSHPEALRNEDDVTMHIPHKSFIDAANKVFATGDQIPYNTPTIDLSGLVALRDLANSGSDSRRLHAALSFAAEYYSVTIRTKKSPDLCDWPKTKRFDSQEWNDLQTFLSFSSLKKGHWTTDPEKYLANLCQVADIIYPVAFATKPHSGLVLVTGGTGSGKTTVLNGLLAKYLGSLFSPHSGELDRRPHVVAIGDPVETAFYAKTLSESAQQQVRAYASRKIDFTARVIKTDTPSVKAALEDALRETTSALVVSELRRDEDFRATLKFAATGQLVFATAHNTSLVDALRKLMMFSGTDGPSNRSLLAQRLKVVIHLQKIELGGKSVTLPSMWLANSAGIRNFVSDGLSSLLPHGTEGSDVGVLGLAWAAEKLCADDPKLTKELRTERQNVRREAHRRDLPIR